MYSAADDERTTSTSTVTDSASQTTPSVEPSWTHLVVFMVVVLVICCFFIIAFSVVVLLRLVHKCSLKRLRLKRKLRLIIMGICSAPAIYIHTWYDMVILSSSHFVMTMILTKKELDINFRLR